MTWRLALLLALGLVACGAEGPQTRGASREPNPENPEPVSASASDSDSDADAESD